MRIIEISGTGPAPFCGMMLADHGAEVIVVHRPGLAPSLRDPLARSRKLVAIDLKTPAGTAQLRELVRSSDGLIEGFRPGVMERLGLGPKILLADAPQLVFGRMTGWGQTGPLARAAGHDINFIALAGALHACGREGGKPTPPVNMLGDFGGGGMLLAFGMVAALFEARRTGKGQVVDCAMTDGAALLMSMIWGFRATAGWKDERGVNLLDTGAPFYDSYETADGKFIAVGAIEPQFYAELRRVAGLAEDAAFSDQMDQACWPDLRRRLGEVFASRDRDAWCRLMEGRDICFAPVLSMAEALEHRHNKARGTFIRLGEVDQPAPAPRFSRTKADPPRAPERFEGSAPE